MFTPASLRAVLDPRHEFGRRSSIGSGSGAGHAWHRIAFVLPEIPGSEPFLLLRARWFRVSDGH